MVLAILLIAPDVAAQETLNAKVLDASTRAPIPYANIGLEGQARGTVSDSVGRFTLKQVEPEAVLLFTAIGYQTARLQAGEVLRQADIFLQPVNYTLPEVEVRPDGRTGEIRQFGLRNTSRGRSVAFATPQLGAELGSPIRIGEPARMQSAHFVLNHVKGDSLLFRLKIYRFEHGQVGELLLRNNVYILEEQRPGEISVDLSGEELVVEGDILLALEWLRDFDELGNRGITFDTKRSRRPNGIFARFSSNGPYQELDYQGSRVLCFYLMGKPAR